MDDDMPLTALAKPKKSSSYDDDMPLVNLATPGASKRGRPSLTPKDPKASPAKPGMVAVAKPGVVVAAGKLKPKKKVESSSSSSSSDSSDSDSSSDSEIKKKKGGASKKQKVRLLAKKKKAGENDEDGENNAISKKMRSPKEQVAVDLLCRWWYVLPDWPPNDPAYYSSQLAERKLRQVSIQEWEWVPELDHKGRRKVYELTQFRGIFRTSDGEKVDLRPMDSCPSYTNMMRKDLPELYRLLVTAYEKQLEDLKNSKYDESALKNSLSIALTRIRDKSHKANALASTPSKKPRLD